MNKISIKIKRIIATTCTICLILIFSAPKAEAQVCCMTLRWKTDICEVNGEVEATCNNPDPYGPCVVLDLCSLAFDPPKM